MLNPYSLISTKKPVLLLLVIIIFLVISNYILLKDMPNPIGKDALAHLMATVSIIREFKLISFLKNPISVYLYEVIGYKAYPPLFYIVAALIRTFFNVNFMFMTPSLFLILLIYSTYKIGEIMENKKAGLLGAVIISFYPIVYLTSRHFNLDLAQTAMVCFTLYLLLQTECFNNRKYSIIFGCVFGIGMLSKHHFIIFIIGPLLVTVAGLFKNFNYNGLKNLVIALLLFGLISLIGYYWIWLEPTRLRMILSQAKSNSELDMARDPLFSNTHLLFYFRSLKIYQMGLLNLVLFLFSLPLFFIKREYRKYHLFFLLWIALPMFVLTLTVAKYNEYTIPYLPAFAIITSLGILSLKHRIIKASIVTIALIFNIFLYINLTFPKYVDNLSVFKISDTFLKCLQVSYTPASHYNPYASKALDPGYKTVRFLMESLKNRKTKIGFVNYITVHWYKDQIKSLLQLYNTPYDIKDCVLDFTDQDLSAFDIIIFISIASLNDQWLNQDHFIQDLEVYNIGQPREECNAYFLWNGVEPLPPRTISISQKQLENVITYFPKAKLIHTIEGPPYVNILIYRSVTPVVQNIGDNAS